MIITIEILSLNPEPDREINVPWVPRKNDCLAFDDDSDHWYRVVNSVFRVEECGLGSAKVRVLRFDNAKLDGDQQ